MINLYYSPAENVTKFLPAGQAVFARSCHKATSLLRRFGLLRATIRWPRINGGETHRFAAVLCFRAKKTGCISVAVSVWCVVPIIFDDENFVTHTTLITNQRYNVGWGVLLVIRRSNTVALHLPPRHVHIFGFGVFVFGQQTYRYIPCWSHLIWCPTAW